MIVKVYSEVKWTIFDDGTFYDSIEERKATQSGTAFLLTIRDERFLITARHVIAGPRVAELQRVGDLEIEPDDYVTKISCRVRVGGLALTPQAIHLSKDFDFAALQMSPEDLSLLRLKALDYSSQPARSNNRVQIWGFPSTLSADSADNVIVSSSDLELPYFILNRAVGTGYSGGPVVFSGFDTTEPVAVVGVISRAEQKQTRVLRMAAIVRELEANRLAANRLSTYKDGMQIYSRE